MWEPSQATSDIDMYWVGPVYVWCGGKGTAPGCAQKREPKGTKRGRGMGSPIPSPQEGAWTREGPRVVGGGHFVRVSVDPFDLEP